MSLPTKLFSKLLSIEIPNRLQLLQCGGIRRDRQIVLIVNYLCIVTIYIGKWLRLQNKIAVCVRKTAFFRTEKRLVFCVARDRVCVRALNKRAFITRF